MFDDGALQLLGRGARILHGHVREGAEALRMACHALGKEFVVLARPAHGGVAIRLSLYTRHRLRQHDVLDVPCVHFRKALIVEVGQPGVELGDEFGGQRSRVWG
ncbi:hypothetical protein D3C87_1819660 [compost metagenome]